MWGFPVLQNLNKLQNSPAQLKKRPGITAWAFVCSIHN